MPSLQELQQEATQLEGAAQAAKTSLDAANEKVAKLQSTLAKTQAVLALRQQEAALDAANKAVVQAQADVETAKTGVETANAAVVQAQANLDANLNSTAQADVVAAQADHDAAVAQLEKVKALATALKTFSDKVKADAGADTTAEVASIKDALVALGQKEADIQAAVDAQADVAQKDMAVFTFAVPFAKTLGIGKKFGIAPEAEAIVGLKQVILTEKIAAAQSIADARPVLQAALQTAQDNVAPAQNAVTAAEGVVVTAQANVTPAQDAVTAAQQAVEALSVSLDSVKAIDVAAAQQSIDDLNAELNTAAAAVVAAQTASDRAAADAAAAKAAADAAAAQATADAAAAAAQATADAAAKVAAERAARLKALSTAFGDDSDSEDEDEDFDIDAVKALINNQLLPALNAAVANPDAQAVAAIQAILNPIFAQVDALTGNDKVEAEVVAQPVREALARVQGALAAQQAAAAAAPAPVVVNASVATPQQLDAANKSAARMGR